MIPEQKKILQDKLEQKRLQIDDAAKNSFILNKGPVINNSQIIHEIQKKQRLNALKIQSERSRFYQFDFWNYRISKNIDLFTDIFFNLSISIGLYPLLTYKTRDQSAHPKEDIAHLKINKANEQIALKGISYGIAIAQINLLNNYYFYKQLDNYVIKNGFDQEILQKIFLADILSTTLKIPLEIKNKLLQINIPKIKFDKLFKNAYRSIFPCILRDSIFKLVNLQLQCKYFFDDKTLKQIFFNKQIDPRYEDKNIDNYIKANIQKINQITFLREQSFIILISVVLSNPFDLMATRLQTQQINKYSGFYDFFKIYMKEEKFFRLFLCGSGYRFIYYWLILEAVQFFKNPLQKAMENAFEI